MDLSQTGRDEVRRLREEYDAAMAELASMSKERDTWRQQHENIVSDLERERKVRRPRDKAKGRCLITQPSAAAAPQPPFLPFHRLCAGARGFDRRSEARLGDGAPEGCFGAQGEGGEGYEA